MHSAHSSASSPRRTTTTTTTVDQDNYNNYSSYHNYNPYSNDPDHSIHARSRSSAQAFPNSPKRRSVFSGRSRSNTTTSSTTSSSRRSPTSSMTSTTDQTPSLPSSVQDASAVSGSSFPHPPPRERQDSITKSLFSRGSRILRRQGSKFNIAATLDEVDEGDREREKPQFNVGDIFARHRSSRQCDSDKRRLISDPFDFHHLTHTNPSQFQSIERARQNDLVTEFSAIRASQKPITSLKGIRAEDLHFRDFSCEDLTGVATSGDDEHAFAIQPAVSPPASPGASSSVSPKQEVPPQRESRVYENFSRPVSRYPRNGSSGSGSSLSTTPPPQRQLASSPEMFEPAPRAIDHVLGLPSQPTFPEQVPPRKTSLSQVNLAALFESDDEGYARAAPDPRASSTNLPSDLEDVPEEEETTATNWHDSPEQPGLEDPSGSRRLSPSPEMGPSSSTAAPKSHPSICVAEELSKKFSEVLASPTLPQYQYYHQQQPQQQENVSKQAPVCNPIYESWDADIDYCYDHAAESTCDFDWSRRSLDDPLPVVEEETDKPEQQSMHLSTSSLPCPELDPSPSQSVPGSQMVVTPSTAFEGDYFQVPTVYPSTVTVGGKQMTQEMYDEYMAADGESDRHFSFYSQGGIRPPMDQSLSPRSSFSPVSKNSQESLILSRAASIARKHRSSVSTTSVPELIHSLASGRENMPTESPSLPRPDSSHHRQTKSLETAQVLLGATGSNASLDSADISPASVHERAQSTSDAIQTSLPKADAPSFPPPVPAKGAIRKKSRTSYSIFPATAN